MVMVALFLPLVEGGGKQLDLFPDESTHHFRELLFELRRVPGRGVGAVEHFE